MKKKDRNGLESVVRRQPGGRALIELYDTAIGFLDEIIAGNKSGRWFQESQEAFILKTAPRVWTLLEEVLKARPASRPLLEKTFPEFKEVIASICKKHEDAAP